MVSKVLVANRGEIACRILRAWSETGIGSVAIFAPNDPGGLFTELADEVVRPEGTNRVVTSPDQ